MKNILLPLLFGALLSLALSGCTATTLIPPESGPGSQTVEQFSQAVIVVVAAKTPPCIPGAITPEVTESPYYKEGSPEENELYQEGMTGQKIVIFGHVYDENCVPIAQALLDFWQAGASGEYDNSGYALRGHTFTDDLGAYSVTTEIPGLYMGRTSHIHVKVAAKEGAVPLTTQLFIPGVEANVTDDIYKNELLITFDKSASPWKGTFDFVLMR